ncbi:MAG: serine/threonine-protein kinase [Clostridiales bacterium]
MLENIPFAGWALKEEIGYGGNCNVYRVEKDGYNAALKQIIIPGHKEYLAALTRFNNNEHEIFKYYEPEKNKMIKEIEIMRSLRGLPGVMIYQDHIIRRYLNRYGWEILILMEYLKPLDKYIIEKGLKVKDTLKMIMDICAALQACLKENILHRDIKEANIFIDKRGDFKIGDFGISKIIDGFSHATTMAGTTGYMAPEVYKGYKYDFRADIYSLGLVMYKILNDNLLPFVKKKGTISDDKIARDMMLEGEIIPKPIKCNDKLYEVLLKACNFNRQERYNSFLEMKNDVEFINENSEENFLNSYAIFPIKRGQKKGLNNESNINLSYVNTISYSDNINNIYKNIDNFGKEIKEDKKLKKNIFISMLNLVNKNKHKITTILITMMAIFVSLILLSVYTHENKDLMGDEHNILKDSLEINKISNTDNINKEKNTDKIDLNTTIDNDNIITQNTIKTTPKIEITNNVDFSSDKESKDELNVTDDLITAKSITNSPMPTSIRSKILTPTNDITIVTTEAIDKKNENYKDFDD